ncbi:MAG: hypothetical protein AB7Q97_14765, partial [Gammaproteobacteria bacterium]
PRRQYTTHPGAVPHPAAVAPPHKTRTRSHAAQEASLAAGVQLSQGNVTGGGYSLFVQDGTLKFAYSLSGARRTVIAADAPLAAAARQLRAEFRYDGVAGRDFGKGGSITLFADGARIGAGRLDATIPYLMSLDDMLDVGMDLGGPVSESYQAQFAYQGRLVQVTVELQ